jgi:hypothetical protein
VTHWLVETPVGGLLLDAYFSRPPFTAVPYFDLVRPQAFVPHHWDGLTPVLADGVAAPFVAGDLEPELERRSVALIAPRQYLDRLVLDRAALHIEANVAVKSPIGVPTD